MKTNRRQFLKSAATLATGAPHEVLEGMAERGEADVIVMGVLALIRRLAR